jgi:RimJ/RimL family protein N-acetyltransferase
MTDLIVFETERLRLAGWREDQIDDLVRLHGDAETARYLSDDGHAWTREECATRLAHWMEIFADHRMGKLRVTRKSDGAFVGRAGFGLHPPKGEPEIGYALLPEYRGQGYASEAAAGLRDWIFRETDHDFFIGFADVRNQASLRVLRGIGMVETHIENFGALPCQFHIYNRPA